MQPESIKVVRRVLGSGSIMYAVDDRRVAKCGGGRFNSLALPCTPEHRSTPQRTAEDQL